MKYKRMKCDGCGLVFLRAANAKFHISLLGKICGRLIPIDTKVTNPSPNQGESDAPGQQTNPSPGGQGWDE